MKYDRETLRSVFQADLDNELVLPDFQRDFVWKKDKQSKLLASILVGLPIGSFLIIKGKKDDFPARSLGFIEVTTPKEQCRFLLDGQQRLSCIKSIFDDLYNPSESWKNIWDKLYGQLRFRWFLRVSPKNSDEDIFGWKKLQFKNNLETYEPDQLLDFIVYHQVLVKGEKDNHWYHPAYKIYDENNQEITGDFQRKYTLATEYSQRNLIPLFEIFSKSKDANALHNLALKKIASQRKDKLKAEVNDGKFSLQEILGHINPNVEKINDSSELESIWLELSSTWAKDIQTALENILDQEILETVLPSNEISRAASIFETINEGGTPLNNFDLIVAKTAKSGKESLAQILKDYIEESIDIPDSLINNFHGTWRMSDMKAIKDNSIIKFVTEQFLNLLSILCNEKKLDKGIDGITVEHIKKIKILNLNSFEIEENYQRTIESLRKAFAFLQFRCGIIDVNDIGYKLMVLPIAYIFSINNERDNFKQKGIWNDKKGINKIEYWYWSSLFSGRYKEKQNERCIQDIKYLYHWIMNDDIDDDYKNKIESHFKSNFENILNKQEYSDKSILLMENEDNLPQKGIKYAILQYILSKEPKDFIPKDVEQKFPTSKLKTWEIAQEYKVVEEHHIIPLGSATSIGESTKTIRNDKNHILNSPLNLSYISKEANREISNFNPSIYLEKLTDATLKTHHISIHFINLLKLDLANVDQLKYKNILEERFNSFKQEIKTELELLIEND
ncbi:DUF262 domain-containing protein [Cyanobacterium aponinum AL20118]|uniref:DUF262 domain-containing protein n=1 Tax=Cyanobacterium aponinum AL20115 TaxID=3090662 RepID=A0AAF0ZE76_9CHRO|nr:DUF262 domain-containing protein [Cyanobacterium aponinum]WPF88640.1 DUF262 domain-containing protein [Cyanobacterium aponinum AL20115]